MIDLAHYRVLLTPEVVAQSYEALVDALAPVMDEDEFSERPDYRQLIDAISDLASGAHSILRHALAVIGVADVLEPGEEHDAETACRLLLRFTA